MTGQNIPKRVRLDDEDEPTSEPRLRFRIEVDPKDAILLDTVQVSQYDVPNQTGEGILLLLEGRANQTDARHKALYVMDEHGAARVMAQMMVLYGAMGPDFMQEVMDTAHAMSSKGLFGPSEITPLLDIE